MHANSLADCIKTQTEVIVINKRGEGKDNHHQPLYERSHFPVLEMQSGSLESKQRMDPSSLLSLNLP